MAAYYVNTNAQPNGDHEVHTIGCPFPPDYSNRLQLGDHPNCSLAVRAARQHFNQVNGCYYCANDCHTQ